MLSLRPNSTIRTNIFGDIWTSQKSIGSSNTSSTRQTPRFHTTRFIQGLEQTWMNIGKLLICFNKQHSITHK
jgi:hypothetical protein